MQHPSASPAASFPESGQPLASSEVAAYAGAWRANDKGHLVLGGHDACELAVRFGTPLYVMDETLVRTAAAELKEGLAQSYRGLPAHVVYASKAFCCTAVCALARQEGLWLDVSSGGELFTAMAASFPPERIVFHGNNKSRSEIRMGLAAGVGRFVVDNPYELALLQAEASRQGAKARIHIRVTPGVEAHTHTYVKTGQTDSKFGFNIHGGQARAAVEAAVAAPNVELVGLHCHIGSQIFELASYDEATSVVLEFGKSMAGAAGFQLKELNLGGGIGIRYNSGDTPPPRTEYASSVARGVLRLCAEYGISPPALMIEPGRAIVGEAGTTLYTIGAVKDIPGIRRYVTVDGGMGDNPRVALYGAVYEAVVANKADRPANDVVSVAGRFCESGDMLIWDAKLQDPEPGDLLAVFATGAYNYSMASNYNRYPRPACVLVHQDGADLVIRRETYRDLVALDLLPERLARDVGVEKAACAAGGCGRVAADTEGAGQGIAKR